MPLRLVLLDRDDTLIRLPPGRRYIAGDDPFELMPGAGEFVAWLNGLGVTVAVATNQQGVSLAEYPEITLESVQRLHDRIQDALQPFGGYIDRFYVCPHAAEMECGCRKPRPGLLRQALWDYDISPQDAVLIGDRTSDLQAAATAGISNRYLLSPDGPPEIASEQDGAVLIRSFRECGELINSTWAQTTEAPFRAPANRSRLIDRFLSWLPSDLPRAPVIVELGSCTGEQACEFAEAFPHARIFAFEAHPESADVCRSNTSPFPNITVIEAAVGDQNGPVKFQSVVDGNLGASSLFRASGHNDIQPLEQVPITVNAVRLDSWARTSGIDHIDLAWLDLQGAELLALRGMGSLLKTVRALQLEITYRELYLGQVLWPEVRRFLESNGLLLVDEWADPCGYFGDAVFLRRD